MMQLKKDLGLDVNLLEQEMHWAATIINKVVSLFLNGKRLKVTELAKMQPPDVTNEPNLYAQLINQQKLGFAERLCLVLSLIPHFKPALLDVFFTRGANDRGYTEFGGLVGSNFSGFIPTAETVMFLLACGSIERRMQLEKMFSTGHVFAKNNILFLGETKPDEPVLSGALLLSKEYKQLLTKGKPYEPTYDSEFPAKKITTQLNWADLVIDHHLAQQLNDLMTWLKNEDTLMNGWGLKKHLKPGYRCLFYGPSGTGKTLAATLIGKVLHRSVYRIDLAMLISKYIGETEKNLSNLFEQAENKEWILFFDEAEALFGKRVEGGTANDRGANQQIAYLLQRLEDYNGLVILASNFENALDDAFTRRFESMIYFKPPGVAERLRLWQLQFNNPNYYLYDPQVLHGIAEKYELSGGKIINVLRYCCIRAINAEGNIIRNEYLHEGIRLELQKDGKTIV